MQPLAGIKIIDFSTRLPGPLATLILAEAGADVVKIEPPGGEELRAARKPWLEGEAAFALLNRGKRSIFVNLKDTLERDRIMQMCAAADVLVEQFRPGVMDRLGLGYADVTKRNPRIVYCALTGYGQDGPAAQKPGHDLTYLAEAGILSLLTAADGTPIVPGTLIADIAGGAYPAALNIMFALFARERTGQGAYLDVAMADNLYPFAAWALANGFVAGRWPKPGQELYTGGSPRYNIYKTADERFVAVAALEQKFWTTFCQAIGFEWSAYDETNPDTRGAIARCIAAHDSAYWRKRFATVDACAVVVNTLEEALADEQVLARGLFSQSVNWGGGSAPALPVPVVEAFRGERAGAPPVALT